MLGPALKVRGGVSAVVTSLLRAFRSDGGDVRYIATHLDGPKLLKATAAVAGSMKLLVSLVFRQCDIVHVHMASHGSFARKASLLRMAQLFGCSTVVHVHGAGFDSFFDQSSLTRKRAITHTLESADLVIALSEEWRSRLSAMAPKAAIRVLMNPVVCAEFADVAAARPDVSQDGGTILFLGAFGRRKGVFDLIEAGVKIAEQRAHFVFELGGDQDVDELRELIAERGLESNVRVLGWVRGQEKLDAFRRAHVFVLPSYHEGLPIAVLEALAAGLPIVTTPVGGIPEVIKDGVNGILIEPGDIDALAEGILRLLDDEALRKRMAGTNVELALRDHDATVVARTLCLWYDDIVAGRMGTDASD
jgi:glycosyltransferase involved in cell wall biosynthesis